MIAFVFPGQGSQAFRMGEFFLKDMPNLRKYYDEANDVLGRNLYKTIFEDKVHFLTHPDDIQPALFVNGYVAYKYFEEKYEYTPSYMAGHSLGEITALAASGAYLFSDGVCIANKRGQLMKESCEINPGVMTSVYQYDLESVISYCEQRQTEQLSVAAMNSRTQIVLSGSVGAIETLERYFVSRGAKIKRLNTIGAFHSPAMQEASLAFKQFLEKVPIHPPRIPVISNVTARPYASKHDMIELLTMQMTNTVQWERIISYFETHFVDMIVDAGPNGVLKNLINKDRRKCRALGLDETQDRDFLEKTLIRQGLPKSSFCELIRLCLCTAVCTPALTQPVDSNNATRMYRELLNLQEQVTSTFYSDDIIRSVFEKSSVLLKCKGYSDEQIKNIVKNIRQEAGLLQA